MGGLPGSVVRHRLVAQFSAVQVVTVTNRVRPDTRGVGAAVVFLCQREGAGAGQS